MKKNLLYPILCLIIFSGLFSSCLNSIDDLYDQYNENFAKSTMLEELLKQQQQEQEKEEEETQKKPGDIDFDESDMLFEEYYVYDDGTLNLAAPPDCYNYQWTVQDPVNGYKNVTIYKFWDGTMNVDVYTKREFIIYVPDSGLESGKTYQLTLTVEDKAGNKYSDVCGIIVYNHVIYKKSDGTTVITTRDSG